jgi:hypothetical protein
MADFDETSRKYLHGNPGFSEIRTLWPCEPDEKGCRLDTEQHCRRKGRLTDRDRAHFFSQARGSLLELETQILIAEHLKYISSAQANARVQVSAKVGRMLNALIDSIRPKHATSAA